MTEDMQVRNLSPYTQNSTTRTKDEIMLSEVASVSDDLGQKQGIRISAHDTDSMKHITSNSDSN